MADGVKGIVLERVNILFSLAQKEVKTNPTRAKRYVRLARKLGTRFRLRLPKELKPKFCKKCNLFWIVGKNVKVRANPKEKRMVYTCECGAKRGFPYQSKRTALIK